MFPRWAKVVLLLLIPVFLFFGSRVFIFYPLWRAKKKAIPVTPQLVAEARAILHEHETSGTHIWWEVAGNVPPVMQSLNPSVITVRRGGEAVDIQLRGGHLHAGLIVVPDPGKSEYSTFEETEHRSRINEHLWEYMF